MYLLTTAKEPNTIKIVPLASKLKNTVAAYFVRKTLEYRGSSLSFYCTTSTAAEFVHREKFRKQAADSFKMAAKSEPDYMELRKDSKGGKENELHIYELDVPKVPRHTVSRSSEDIRSASQQQSALEYHYVRSCEPMASKPHHGSAIIAAYAPDAERSQIRLREELDKKLKGRRVVASRTKRSCSVNSVKLWTVLLLLVLTILNTLLAVAALTIGGAVYSRLEGIQRLLEYNNTTPGP